MSNGLIPVGQLRYVLPLEKVPESEKYERYDNLENFVFQYVEDWNDVLESGVGSDRIEDLWEHTDLGAVEVQDAFQSLKRRGELYEPSAEVYKPYE